MQLIKRLGSASNHKLLIFLVVFFIGLGFGSKYLNNTPTHINLPPENAFLSESIDIIKENYWEKLSDVQLIDMFKKASSTLGNPLPSEISNKDELIRNLNQDQAVKLVSHVLANLKPVGRSGLYTQKQEVELKNVIENRNPETGVVEPTIFTRVIGSNILYLQFKKFSPTSYDEFLKAFENYQNNSNLNALIFDLRGNVGGAIDTTPYFLGLFLGKNQYAYDFYKKEEYLPFKTPTDKLASVDKFKQIVILVDNQTQSSAEVMIASLKKYHVGVVVGVPTKGWGTVERVFPLDNQISKSERYSIFLVHSITLRDDNQPIEGRGVEPNINLKDAGWEDQLYSYFRNQQLLNALKLVI